LEGSPLLGVLGLDTDARRRGCALTVGMGKGRSGYVVGDGVGVAGGAAEDMAVASKERANSGHLSRVGVNLRAEVDHFEQLVDGVFSSRGSGRLPELELSQHGELGNANGVGVRVEDGERNGTVGSDASDSSGDDDVEVTGPGALANAIKENERADRHRGRHLDANDLFETAGGNLDVTGGEGERSYSRGERLRLEDARGETGGGGDRGGRRRLTVHGSDRRATEGGETAAKAAVGMVVTSLGGSEVDDSTGGVVEVIADDEAKAKPIDNSYILHVEGAARDVEAKVDPRGDQASTTDTAKLMVTEAVGDLAVINHIDAVGVIKRKLVGKLRANEGERAARVGTVGSHG
jgi:hypothetical protein